MPDRDLEGYECGLFVCGTLLVLTLLVMAQFFA